MLDAMGERNKNDCPLALLQQKPVALRLWQRVKAERGNLTVRTRPLGGPDLQTVWAALAAVKKLRCPMTKPLTRIAGLVGLVFLALAGLYWLTPAGQLPAFLPGYEEGSANIHERHALAL